MAGKKKKLSRREQKRLEQQKKNRVRRRTGWQEPETPEMNWQLLEDLRPFLNRPDLEKGLIALMELAADSDNLVDEPEFTSLFFSPIQSIMLFAAVMEEQNLLADDYFTLDEEVRTEKFFEVVEEILPQLFTEEFRQTFIERCETARTRFRNEGNEQKLWQTSAAQFVLEMKGDEGTEFYPGLLHMIASKSVEAGPLMIRPDDEEDEAAVDEEAMEQKIDEIPGLHDYLNEVMRAAQERFVHEMLDGDLLFHLFTNAELEEAIELTEQEEVDTLEVVGDFLTGILTEQRRTEMGERLDEVIADLPEHLAGTALFLKDIQDGLPELAPQTASWAALVAALIGEMNTYDPD
ncbi:MAG TPA: hypothetical protein PLD25_16090 [Chloroflexota bacterium]|nr:hypothetical protein [Chloroflexota bacterium]